MSEESIEARIEKFRARRESTVYPDDIVKALFGLRSERNFVKDVETLHRALYELKKKEPDILKDFVFDESTRFPYSKMLEEVLTRLETASVLGAINPGFNQYEIREEQKKTIIDKVKRKFDEETIEKLKQMSSTFGDLVAASG